MRSGFPASTAEATRHRAYLSSAYAQLPLGSLLRLRSISQNPTLPISIPASVCRPLIQSPLALAVRPNCDKNPLPLCYPAPGACSRIPRWLGSQKQFAEISHGNSQPIIHIVGSFFRALGLHNKPKSTRGRNQLPHNISTARRELPGVPDASLARWGGLATDGQVPGRREENGESRQGRLKKARSRRLASGAAESSRRERRDLSQDRLRVLREVKRERQVVGLSTTRRTHHALH